MQVIVVILPTVMPFGHWDKHYTKLLIGAEILTYVKNVDKQLRQVVLFIVQFVQGEAHGKHWSTPELVLVILTVIPYVVLGHTLTHSDKLVLLTVCW